MHLFTLTVHLTDFIKIQENLDAIYQVNLEHRYGPTGKILGPFRIIVEIPKALKPSFCLGIIPFGTTVHPSLEWEAAAKL